MTFKITLIYIRSKNSVLCLRFKIYDFYKLGIVRTHVLYRRSILRHILSFRYNLSKSYDTRTELGETELLDPHIEILYRSLGTNRTCLWCKWDILLTVF